MGLHTRYCLGCGKFLLWEPEEIEDGHPACGSPGSTTHTAAARRIEKLHRVEIAAHDYLATQLALADAQLALADALGAVGAPEREEVSV